MKNFLDNGTVLPQGLHGTNAGMSGFNKTYRNTQMRLGVVVASYPVEHEKNITKLAPEYDVVAIEQNEDRGSTSTLYRNALSATSLGGIADFFEKTIRARKKKKYKGESTRLNEQNGDIVLLLCLDGNSEKAMIIGSFPHPDRKTTLKDEGPRMEGEYNGVNIKVEKDGSTSITFRGATDNDGKLIDEKQGPTSISISKDGSYEVKHKTITQTLAKSGKASLTADDDISNTTKKNFNVTATESVNVTATKDANLKMDKLVIAAQGSANMSMQKLGIKSQSEIKIEGTELMIEAASMAKVKSAMIVLDGIVALGGDGGQPILLVTTQMLGIGNLGIPVLSTAIAGFATKVTAQ